MQKSALLLLILLSSFQDFRLPTALLCSASMASISATCLNFGFSQLSVRPQNVKLFPMATTISFPSTRTSRSRVSCSAATETVEKVCEIVKKQLALPAETELTPESKFSDLGADSLDTVEIVMGLEEEFDINVEEDNSENIATVQQAADLIDKLIQQKAKA